MLLLYCFFNVYLPSTFLKYVKTLFRILAAHCTAPVAPRPPLCVADSGRPGSLCIRLFSRLYIRAGYSCYGGILGYHSCYSRCSTEEKAPVELYTDFHHSRQASGMLLLLPISSYYMHAGSISARGSFRFLFLCVCARAPHYKV
jgi:hypothetical protein